MRRASPRRVCGGMLLAGSVLLLTGCARDGSFQPVSMWNNSRIKPLEESTIPGHASSALPIPAGTVARGEGWRGDPLNTGRIAGQLMTSLPFTVTPELLARGQGRFNVYCTPCHGRLGNGQGIVVQRGFPHPPDYAIKRLRDAPVGHFFD